MTGRKAGGPEAKGGRSRSDELHTTIIRTAALIAAGQGERLRAGGVRVPKPLVRIAGRPLIDRVLDAVAAAGIQEVACIFNAEADEVEAHCRQSSPLPLRVVRRTTPNSMESLFALAPQVQSGPFLLLTVDAVFGPKVLPTLMQSAAAHPDADGILGMHDFVDDEKPLRLAVGADARVLQLGAAAHASPLITAGLYVFAPRIFREIPAARAAGLGALREFLGHLLARDYRLYGVRVPKTIDVDRPEDVRAADDFVRSGFAEETPPPAGANR